MIINEEHKSLLIHLGLRDEDLPLFDGDRVRYEFDPQKGVRLYDPYFRTSYREFIDVDGWSAWSSEQDTFQAGILKENLPEAARRAEASRGPAAEDIATAMKKRFRKKKGV